MSFEAKDYPISDILNKAVFEIPRNQRRYVWKKESWQNLFEDVLFSISENKPHFVGSIVLEKGQKKDGLSYYTIIDGQQRLTTITLFLVAIMKHFRENDMMDDFLGTVSYLQSKNTSNKDIVILHSEFHTSISNIIKGMIELEEPKCSISAFVDTHILSKSRDKNIGDAVKYYYRAIKEDLEVNDNIKARLCDIRSALLEMTAVKIESSSEEDSYTIFEILNARGQELASHELLKNYIMRYIQPIELRDEAKSNWEDMERALGSSIEKFVRHYTIHRYGDTRDKFSSPYKAIQQNSRGCNIGKLYQDIKLKSEYYKKLIHPSIGLDGNCCCQTEFEIFEFFRVKRFEQFRPVLLSLMHQREKENISPEKYELALKYIYNFFVCYTIIGEEKSSKLESVVFKYAKMLEDNYSDDLLREFAANLKDKIPGYDWFLNAFQNLGWSNHYGLYTGDKNKKRVQVVLEVIERHVSQRSVIPEFTIEHMLPDSEDIRHSQIGNLVPLEERLNGKLGHTEFNEKLDTYEQSCFTSCRRVANIYRGKIFDPEKRTVFLAKLMYRNILKLDQLDFSHD